MLEALRTNNARRQIARTKSYLAPTKGWYSTQNVLAGVSGTANLLVNMFPRAETVDLRGGWKNHCNTGAGGPVNSIFAYNSAISQALFCARGNTIYNVTTNTPAATTINTLTSDKLITVNFSNSGGHFLFAVNGQNNAVHYNGAAWATPAITGLSSATFDYVTVYKSRLFFVIKNSLSFAFLPTEQIAGVADDYLIGNVCNKGGKLVAIETWTIDGGFGPDDYLVCLTNMGQAAIYKGSDPANSSAWDHVGTFDLPAPIGKRCMLKVGGDLYINTMQGVVPLSKAISLDKAAVNNFTITKNIAPDVNALAKVYGDNFGWEVISYAKGTMAIVNVPLSENEVQHQLVMNTITGAWCRFTNQNANCWCVFKDDLYFGGNDGIVRQADCAGSDGGADIIGDIRLPDDSFGSPATIKAFGLIRVNILSDGTATPRIALDVDFAQNIPTGQVQATISDIIKWDEFNWDEANWPNEQALFNTWQPANCNPGYTAAIRMRISASGGNAPVLLQINGFDVSYEMGGTL